MKGELFIYSSTKKELDDSDHCHFSRKKDFKEYS